MRKSDEVSFKHKTEPIRLISAKVDEDLITEVFHMTCRVLDVASSFKFRLSGL